MILKVFMQMKMLIVVVAPCNLVCVYQRFGGTYRLHLHGGTKNTRPLWPPMQNFMPIFMKTDHMV
jgi:hypothetical protein